MRTNMDPDVIYAERYCMHISSWWLVVSTDLKNRTGSSNSLLWWTGFEANWRPSWKDHRRSYWRFQWHQNKEGGNFVIQLVSINIFRSSTFSRKCQSFYFRFCNATVLLRWSLQYGRRWLQFPKNRCSIQSYFWDQWLQAEQICDDWFDLNNRNGM